MQFGRLMGIGLVVLGLMLIVIQAGLYFGRKKETNSPSTPAPESTPSGLPVPAILGGFLLLGGSITFLVARRSDEPDPAHAIK